MEFKGTKEEWFVGEADIKGEDSKELVVAPREQIELNGGFRVVCFMGAMKYVDDEDLANAKLISKAPEMLKMLKLIEQQLKERYTINYSSQIHFEIEQLIKSATEL